MIHNICTKRVIGILLISGTLAFATGCSNGGSHAIDGVSLLNRETNTINFPIYQYQLSPKEHSKIVDAKESVIERCLSIEGIVDPRKQRLSPSEDRPFGVWNPETTSLYGFSMPPRDQNGILDDAPPWDQGLELEEQVAHEKCVGMMKDELSSISVSEDLQIDSMSNQILFKSFEQVSKSTLARKLNGKWSKCLLEHGLSKTTGHGTWTSDDALAQLDDNFGNHPEREIGIATIEARCNEDLKVTEKLSKQVAELQKSMIDENIGALENERKTLDGYVKAATTILGE